jgi:hypothetical protein
MIAPDVDDDIACLTSPIDEISILGLGVSRYLAVAHKPQFKIRVYQKSKPNQLTVTCALQQQQASSSPIPSNNDTTVLQDHQ